MKKALIDPSGRVVQVVDADQAFPVHESLKWVECPDGTETDATWDGQGFEARSVADPGPRSAADPTLGVLAEVVELLGIRDKLSEPSRALLDQSSPRKT